MSVEPPRFQLSEYDTQQFGFTCARAWVSEPDHAGGVDAFCRDNGVRLVITRTPAHRIDTAQALERAGHFITDTLVYYVCPLAGRVIPEDRGTIPVRPARVDEAGTVKAVAGDAFHGYFSHYHADPGLDPARCDAVFMDWTYRSIVDRKMADIVFVAGLDGEIKGFATVRINSPQEGEGVLFGVHPSAQRQGLYRSFMVSAMAWLQAQGCDEMVVSTQVNNVAVQKSWTRLGFEINRAYYTFHRWYA